MAKQVVASEEHLRLALKQQLLHNEQQNIAMTKMSRSLGRAGRLITSLNANVTKVEADGMMREAFYEEAKVLLEKFEATNQRGSKSAPKRG